MTSRSSYKALITIFNQQCEVSAGKVVVKAKTGGDCMQNPSDPTATYDAHKARAIRRRSPRRAAQRTRCS